VNGKGNGERGTGNRTFFGSKSLSIYVCSLAFRILPHISIRFFSKAMIKVFS
jgi:hypothetical protein